MRFTLRSIDRVGPGRRVLDLASGLARFSRRGGEVGRTRGRLVRPPPPIFFPVARAMLAAKKIPPFKPFYLKPASYERYRG